MACRPLPHGERSLKPRSAVHGQHTAPDLVFFNGLEQRLEVAFAEAIVALALDELEEDRPDGVGGEDLQQHLGVAAIHHALPVDQDAVSLQARDVLAMLRQARVDLLEVRIRRRRHERQSVGAQFFDGVIDILHAAGDVLDALAAIRRQIFLDLPGIARVLVDRNPDLAVRAGQRAREQAGRPALDVKEADLAEVEQLLIKAGPHIHPPAMHVVGQVVEIEQSGAFRVNVLQPEPVELGVVGRAFLAVTIHEIQQAAADTLDRGNIQRLLRRSDIRGLRAERQRALIGPLRVNHAERHRRRAGAMRRDEIMAVGARLFVDQIVHVALTIDRDRLGLVAGDRREPHQPEQRVELFGLRMGIFDKLEAVGTHRIVLGNDGSRRVVRKRTHGDLP